MGKKSSSTSSASSFAFAGETWSAAGSNAVVKSADGNVQRSRKTIFFMGHSVSTKAQSWGYATGNWADTGATGTASTCDHG